MKNILVLICTLVVACMLSGCTQTATESQASASPAISITEPACNPVRVAIMLDKTGSANQMRTPLMSDDDVDLYFEVLRKCGGELGVGLITDDSNRSLLRVRIDAPPMKPAAPANENNPFAGAIAAGKYEQEKQNYDSQFAVWKEAMEKRLAPFRQDLNALVTAPSSAPKTDIWGAVGRIELFLGEDESSWKTATKKFGILVSDCEDNVHRKTVTPKSAASWIVVNGTPVAQLPTLSPVRFESIGSAARHIAAK